MDKTVATVQVTGGRKEAYQEEGREVQVYDFDGCERIAVAILAQAARDARTGRWDYRDTRWVTSTVCQNLCELLGYEHERFVQFVIEKDRLRSENARRLTEASRATQETRNESGRSFHMAGRKMESL